MRSRSRLPSTHRRRAWLFTAMLVLCGPAFAYDGFTVGLSGGVPTGGAYVLNVRAVQPITTTPVNGTPLQFSARVDLATPLSFGALPAAGIGALVGSEAEGIERYLGVGTGTSVPVADDIDMVWSVYGLAGYRAPITAGVHGVLEVQIASSTLFTAPQVTLGVEYGFGGER